MRRLLLLAAAALLPGCPSGNPGFPPPLPDEEPFHAPRELRIETGSALDTVPLGIRVPLSWDPGGFVQYLWTLETPPGSAATLSDPTDADPSFVPDLPGVYLVRVATSVGGTPVERATRKLTAAAYLGQEACALCHADRVASQRQTMHGRTLEVRATELLSTPGCLNCHVLGADAAEPAAAPGGWDDLAESAGFDPLAYPYTTHAQFASDFPALADRGSVQCESCHGAASLHESDPRRTEVSLKAEMCGDCHSSFGPRYTQYLFSDHVKDPPAATVNDASCSRCHTASAFARTLSGRPLREEAANPPGVTCAACHDPHSAANPSDARRFGTVDLAGGGSLDCGRAGSCVTCHQAEVTDPAAHAAGNLRFPCAVQAEMLLGRGAVEYGNGYISSFHGDPGFKLRNFTGDPDDPLYAEACVTCHMAPTPASGPLRDRIGGHTWKLRSGSTELVLGNCDRCHLGLTTFDRNVGRDYDGDGAAEGIQTEIRGLLERVHTVLEAADAQNGLSRPGGAGTEIVVAGDLSLTTVVLREGAYNHNFVVRDGSVGVHNTLYAVQVLQRTYEQVTGAAFATAFPGAYIP